MTVPIIHAMLRVKNEARWIARVLGALDGLTGEIHLLDDRSTDDTASIAEKFTDNVYRTPFDTLDESRDKNWLLDKVWGRAQVGDWLLCIDGDEELERDGLSKINRLIEQNSADAYSLKIEYLWDRENQVRTDGIYGRFYRPSLFRLVSPAFGFGSTEHGNGANLHCSSAPQRLLANARRVDLKLWHWGYFDRALRVRKYEFYNRIDPGNQIEDCYRHVVQGDVPEVPADASLKHAGPLTLRTIPPFA